MNVDIDNINFKMMCVLLFLCVCELCLFLEEKKLQSLTSKEVSGSKLDVVCTLVEQKWKFISTL